MSTIQSPALMFTAPRKVEIQDVDVPQPGPGEVLIRSIVSGISAGTEMNVYRGLAPQWRKHQDSTTGLFVETDRPDWVYPSRYGYAVVGRVEKVGDGVTAPSLGDLVFAYAPHGYFNAVPARITTRLPDGLPPEIGLFVANLNTALNGVLDARPVIGSTCVVFGLGVIGQIITRLLVGMRQGLIVGVDGLSRRRDVASASGANRVLSPTDKVAERIRELTDNRGADIAIDVSGSAAALHEAIRTVGFNGTVIAMSWYGGSFEHLSLSGEFHHNRVRIISSQVGAINPDLGPLWSTKRRAEAAMGLLGALRLEELITHRVDFENAPEAYRMIDEQPGEVLQVALTYHE